MEGLRGKAARCGLAAHLQVCCTCHAIVPAQQRRHKFVAAQARNNPTVRCLFLPRQGVASPSALPLQSPLLGCIFHWGGSFVVHPRGFVVHVPHERSPSFFAFRGEVEGRARRERQVSSCLRCGAVEMFKLEFAGRAMQRSSFAFLTLITISSQQSGATASHALQLSIARTGPSSKSCSRPQ